MSDYEAWEIQVANAARALAGDPDPSVNWRGFAYAAMMELAGCTPGRPQIGACNWRQQGVDQPANVAARLYMEQRGG